jgi:hypothetical protein
VLSAIHPLSFGQAPPPKRAGSSKPASPAEQVSELTKQVHQDEALLQNPDVISDKYRAGKVKEDWILASCKLELLTLPDSIKTDPVFVDGLWNACRKRLQTSEPPETKLAEDREEPTPALQQPRKSNGDGSAPPACPNEPISTDRVDLEPTVEDISSGTDVVVSGKVKGAKDGKVQICVNGQPVKKLGSLHPEGAFKVDVGRLTDGETVTAQYMIPGKGRRFSPFRSVLVGAKSSCPGLPQDDSEAPNLTPGADSGSNVVVSGAFKKIKKGKLQFCLDGKPQPLVDVGDDGKFSSPFSTLKDNQKIQAQLVNVAANGSAQSFGKTSNTLVVGSCKQLAGTDSTKIKPILTAKPDAKGKIDYSGTFSKDDNPPSNTVRICVDDTEKGPTLTVTDKTFDAGTLDLKAGAVVTAQLVITDKNGKKTYGPLSDELPVGNCSEVQSGDTTNRPTLGTIENQSTFASVQAQDKNPVRICVNDAPITPPLDASGGAVALPSGKSFVAGQKVSVQEIVSAPGDFPRKYGILSSRQKVLGYNYSALTASFIGGVEQSTFSSQVSSTNAFLSAYLRSRYIGNDKFPSTAVWSRIRLLGAPTSSATSSNNSANFNVVAALTNPSGTITTSNLQTIGQAVDYVVGPELRLKQWDRADGNTDRISLLGAVGATSPLSSTQLQYSLQAPPSDTQQCFQLVNAYPNFLKNSAANTSISCTLVNSMTGVAVKTLSFTSADRSNFLIKYGAGIRFTHIYPAKGDQAAYAGNVDFLIGQDQAITGGKYHGVVFRIDAVYPLAFGASSYIYLFGSASMKATGNSGAQSIILATTPNPAPPLANDVIVLPLQQPNRDFYRIGVGINITSIFCSLSKDGCNKSSTTTSGGSTGSGTSSTVSNPEGGTGSDSGKAPKS